MTPTYPAADILIFYAAAGLSVAAVLGTAYVACAAVQAIRRRRADRAWAAGIAERVHDRRYLELLDSEFRAMDAEERQ